MRRLAAVFTALALAFILTGCSLLPQQTDAADEAILRVVALDRQGEELTITAMTAGIQTGDSSEPPETVEGTGNDYAQARRDMLDQRQASLVHTTDWVVSESALGDLLEAFLTDPELTYAARLYLLKDQSVEDFLAAFEEEETGPARSLADLDRALGQDGVTVLECSALLAEGKACDIPALRAEDGKLEVVEEVTVTEWK